MKNRKIFMGTMLILISILSIQGFSRNASPACLPESESGDDAKAFTVGKLQVKASAKTIVVSIADKAIFELPARVAMDVAESPDSDLSVPSFRKEGDRCVWTVKSSNWEKKEYSLSAEGSAVVLRVKVYGKGKLGKLRYFQEDRKAGQSLGYEVSRYFVPVALGGAQALPQWRNTMEDGSIKLSYLAPTILAFPFEGNFQGSCAVGLAPKPGGYNFDHFTCEFSSKRDGLFSTDFYGYTEVDGEYELPAIIFNLGNDEFDALAVHSEWLYQFWGCQKVDRTKVPRWWLGPFFCGWGEQSYLSTGNNKDAANQKNYTMMSNRLDELGLKPSVIIIDDKWQKEYGVLLPDPEKWPDLRSFVDTEHAKGRRVLLWMKSWDKEGLSPEECIKSNSTLKGADPTSPVYQKRIKETMHKLLSDEPGCFNCDGFKIDFLSTLPTGKDLEIHEPGVYGIELQKRLFKLIYESAKAVKPECLINSSTCHPYFSEVTDQSRLHDYNPNLRYIWEVREFRAKIFQAAFPGISIDTDDPNCTSKEQVMNYIRRSPELGVPDLYKLHRAGSFELNDDDFREIARIWKAYSLKLDKK